jgi:multidrug efflux pump subunit AcrB
MGMIMSVGVSISNCVLMITNAEELRRKNGNAILSAKEAASVRLRPILMTSVAMVAGMIPMAAGFGEGGDQAAPLGRAVIGGLIASTFAALLVLPLAFAWLQNKTCSCFICMLMFHNHMYAHQVILIFSQSQLQK